MAEHTYFPRSFGVATAQAPQQDGTTTDVMELRFQDTNGDVVKIVMGELDFEAFRVAVQDPEGFAERQRARAKLALPDNLRRRMM